MARRRRKRTNRKETMGIVALIALIAVISHPAILLVALVCLALVAGVWIFLGIQKNLRLKRSGINDIDRMEGTKFEQYLGVMFRTLGYKVRVTKASGDFGADLILQRDGKRIIVQAKRYIKPVGVKAVQEVNTALAHYGATEGWVVTNNTYTDAAVSLARSNQVRLIDRQGLIKLILQVQKKPTQQSEVNAEPNAVTLDNNSEV